MDKIDRIQQLHRFFLSRKYPVRISILVKELESTATTIKRNIKTMQLYMNAPLEYCEKTKGWHYNRKQGEKIELPGLWLTANELQSLSALLAILQSMDNGFLGEEVNLIEKQIGKLLTDRNINLHHFTQRMKFLPMAKRDFKSNIFAFVCEGLLQRKQLDITYKDARGNSTHRNVSPQTLAYYRDNWYLDCWCHLRQQLRTFSISRITQVETTKLNAKEISQDELRAHFSTSYGIFAGKGRHTAKLRFYPEVAHHIASQQWHPDQVGVWEGQYYLLSFPYGDDRELILDILKQGNNVEVLAPAKLKNAVISRLRGALELYS